MPIDNSRKIIRGLHKTVIIKIKTNPFTNNYQNNFAKSITIIDVIWQITCLFQGVRVRTVILNDCHRLSMNRPLMEK